jgi:hypothetical protein
LNGTPGRVGRLDQSKPSLTLGTIVVDIVMTMTGIGAIVGTSDEVAGSARCLTSAIDG